MSESVIVNLRWVKIGSQAPVLEITRGFPLVDASGAICGFRQSGSWELVHTAHYESAASYEEHRSVADLVASGGIVDAP